MSAKVISFQKPEATQFVDSLDSTSLWLEHVNCRLVAMIDNDGYRPAELFGDGSAITDMNEVLHALSMLAFQSNNLLSSLVCEFCPTKQKRR